MKREIKKLANSGQMNSAKLLAKNLISIRKQKERMIQSKSQLGSIETKSNVKKKKKNSIFQIFQTNLI